MTGTSETAKFRNQLVEDYQGALIRLATLRADAQQYLLFAWVELYPHDMLLPKGWTSERWTVPGTGGWTCAVSATKAAVAESLDWYEAAAVGRVTIPGKYAQRGFLQATALGPEPAYGQFCTGEELPFAHLWHQNPRTHCYIALRIAPAPARRIGSNEAARRWLSEQLGFDLYRFDEWLGGLALVAPDPLCSSVDVFPTARSDDGRETLMAHAEPRRSAERGRADLSQLEMHIAERRAGGWAFFQSMRLNSATSLKFDRPQYSGEIGFALVCPQRGLLRFVTPHSWMEQIGLAINAQRATLRIEVPHGGRRKPAKAVVSSSFHPSTRVSVGSALEDAARSRLIAVRERRKAREKRAGAAQRLFGRSRSVSDAAEIQRKRQEAEDFVVSLVSRAQRRVIFVDPFFSARDLRLFALRVSHARVSVRVLTGQPGWSPLFAADLRHVANEAKGQTVVVPTVRVMSGGSKPEFHDRYLVIDKEVWHCGPSFNELGDRFGVMVRLPDPVPVLLVINEVWHRSQPSSGLAP